MESRRLVRVLLVVAVVAVSTIAVILVPLARPAAGLIPFASYQDLSSFLDSARSAAQGSPGMFGPTEGPATPTAGPASPSPPSYSGTNVQVAGVDELDMVKTDGTHLFIASGGQVSVLLAYPASEMRVLSNLSLGDLTQALVGSNATHAEGAFLDGSTLLVVADLYGFVPGIYNPMPPMLAAAAGGALSPIPAFAPSMTFAFLFNVSDATNPVLEHTIVVSGSVSTGRLVGSTAYLVATQWIQEVNGTYVLPELCVDGACSTLESGQIYHDPQSTDSWDYTNLLALDLGTGDAQMISVVTGGWSTLYMSPSAIYLAFQKFVAEAVRAVPIGFMPIFAGSGYTSIYKLTASGLTLTPNASADVPGFLRNQYSMDEWNGDLRVATTVRAYNGTTVTIRNDLYVFDASMAPVGSFQGLAPGETIFAVRFVEDKAYVVTFRQIDPLFVVDLSDPAHPAVSGYLEMPGFSDYLYPLDSAHLLGVGKDAIPAEEGNWSWYQGLKVALYDVGNASAPSEAANVTIGDRGTDSTALQDPHAFLYIPGRQLLVLPVDLAVLNASEYPDGVPPYAYGTVVWQGAYVYEVNETTGFTLLGRVALDNGTVSYEYGWYDSSKRVLRSLYIGDVLYTISSTQVLSSSLADLSAISTVTYASPPSWGYVGPVSPA